MVRCQQMVEDALCLLRISDAPIHGPVSTPILQLLNGLGIRLDFTGPCPMR